ncbi:hypothetical protein [Labrys sp. WJW]|nr:hypothetical protein [Labrys sp. WJW]
MTFLVYSAAVLVANNPILTAVIAANVLVLAGFVVRGLRRVS